MFSYNVTLTYKLGTVRKLIIHLTQTLYIYYYNTYLYKFSMVSCIGMDKYSV